MSTIAEIDLKLTAVSWRRPKDLWTVLGSKSHASEILSGKRSISKDQAKKLASFFKVSADLFL